MVDAQFCGHDALVRLELPGGEVVLSRVRGPVPDVGSDVALRCTERVLAFAPDEES